jgi:hypothetical protein
MNPEFFDKVVLFVKDLKEVFSDERVFLFHKLLTNIPDTKPEAREKLANVFSQWILANKEAIAANDADSISDEPIKFTDKVCIPIKELMASTDAETKQSIKKHLLFLLYLVEPSDKLKETLSADRAENEFINTFFNKIDDAFNGQQFNDPMTATVQMLNSGIFTDLVQSMNDGVNSGKINLNKLLGNVQGMLGALQETDSTGEISSIINTVGPMMGSLMGTGENMDIHAILNSKPDASSKPVGSSKPEDHSN